VRILQEPDDAIPPLERTGSVGFLETIGERAALFGDPREGF
jgi:hypothetical protein